MIAQLSRAKRLPDFKRFVEGRKAGEAKVLTQAEKEAAKAHHQWLMEQDQARTFGPTPKE